MLRHKLHFCRLSRLMAGLFVVQVLAASFCLLTPESHAANTQAAGMQIPISGNMMAHCDNDAKTESGSAGHDVACTHCDQQGELVPSNASIFNIDIDLPLLMVVSAEIDLPGSASINLSSRPLTGPPPRFSLLYHTNQRILI